MTRSLAKRHLPLPNTVCTLTCPCESEMIALFLLRMVIVDLEPSDIPSTNQVLPRPCCPMHCTVLYCTVLCPPNKHSPASLDHRKELIQSEIWCVSDRRLLIYTRSTESDCLPPTRSHLPQGCNLQTGDLTDIAI